MGDVVKLEEFVGKTCLRITTDEGQKAICREALHNFILTKESYTTFVKKLAEKLGVTEDTIGNAFEQAWFECEPCQGKKTT